MKQKILVAFDDSDNAMRSVKYVAETFKPEYEITLFSVVPDTAALCQMNSPELTPYFHSKQVTFCALEDKKRELLAESLEKAKDLLISFGIKKSNITLKIETKKKGIARDVVAEAHMGYDILVMGRRGLSGIMEFMLGSISLKILNLAKDVSILVVN